MQEKILELMNNKKYKPLTIDEIYQKLELKTTEDFVNLTKTLCSLEDEYLIARNKKNKYATFESLHLVKGIINVKEAGFGFLANELFDEDIYISQDNRNTALNNDTVLVHYFLRHNRIEGEVVEIIKRNTFSIIGTLKKYKGKNFVEAIDSRNKLSLFIPSSLVNNAVDGNVVEVNIKRYYEDAKDLNKAVGEGKITRIYGDYNDPGMDITSLLLSKGYDLNFPLEVRDEVSLIKDHVEEKELIGRVDLTNKLIVTIDGDDAKDFDDAISVSKLDNGNYLLGVYIADVSNYVKLNSSLDKEAYKRGTSVYLPDRVLPMLPKELSNGLCSLNEGVIRLVLAVEMEIDSLGKVVNQNIFKGYMKSSARLTYNIVNRILVDHDEKLIKQYEYLVPMLKTGEELAKILYNMRIERGAFDFETMESKIILDDNLKAIDIKLRTRDVSEKMIEEFMLITNDTVAESMKWLGVPFVYRVHDEPKEEKINSFIDYCKPLGIEVKNHNPKQLAKSLQQIYLSINTNDDYANNAIGTMLIRSMAKAKYQTHNIGHFGLQSECYTHFTSPIRRYPDLMVHRLVKEFLLNEHSLNDPYSFYNNYLDEACLYASEREKLADSTERDAEDIKKAEYMQDKIGLIFDSTIISVTNHGLYVVLDNLVEGLVRFENLPNDYYIYLDDQKCVVGEKTHHTFSIGNKVKVKLIHVNKKKRQIEFELIKKII